MLVMSEELLVNFEQDFCCSLFKEVLSEKRSPLYFDEDKDLYYFHIHYQRYVQLLCYCPWCCKKILQKDVSCDYSEKLFYELYLKDSYVLYDMHMMSPRFQNDDEWHSYGLPCPAYDFYIEVDDAEKATQYKLGKYEPNCCSLMRKALEDPHHAMEYVPLFRHYVLGFDYTPCRGKLIKNCPWCATVFPISLYKEYQRLILENIEFDEDDFTDLSYFIKKFPQEFQTDEWWKKRGL